MDAPGPDESQDAQKDTRPLPAHLADPAGDLGEYPRRQWFRLAKRAIREGWDIPPTLKAKILAMVNRCLDSGTSWREQIAAGRLVVSADLVNVAIARNQSADHATDKKQAAAALRATLAQPGARALLAQLAALRPPDGAPPDWTPPPPPGQIGHTPGTETSPPQDIPDPPEG